MLKEIQHEAETRMKKCVETLGHELAKIRTGRAHPSLLDSIMVFYYGNPTPLTQVATVTIADPRTLAVTPWEKNMTQAIEKAIRTSDLGLNPATSSASIHVPLPALTEERRKELVKHVRSEAEKARVLVRNIRRDANASAKELLKAKKITEDDERRGEDSIQKLTDRFIIEVDKQTTAKEAELMQI